MLIKFTLNGEAVALEAAADRRAVDLLREDLCCTGVKESCGSGECGACAVLYNGEARLSCLMMACQLDGAVITTVEGLACGEALHPLQDAFIRKGAVQCGYCTPGMLISAADLLRRNPFPTRQEIRTAISGNLCRCTGYQKIVDAVEEAAGTMGAGAETACQEKAMGSQLK